MHYSYNKQAAFQNGQNSLTIKWAVSIEHWWVQHTLRVSAASAHLNNNSLDTTFYCLISKHQRVLNTGVSQLALFKNNLSRSAPLTKSTGQQSTNICNDRMPKTYTGCAFSETSAICWLGDNDFLQLTVTSEIQCI